MNTTSRIFINLFLLGSLALARTLPATGATPAALPATWVKVGGPIGGLGYDVRYGAQPDGTLDTGVMYVTDNYSGVNKSTNGGRSWFTTNTGITERSGTSKDAVPVFS